MATITVEDTPKTLTLQLKLWSQTVFQNLDCLVCIVFVVIVIILQFDEFFFFFFALVGAVMLMILTRLWTFMYPRPIRKYLLLE